MKLKSIMTYLKRGYYNINGLNGIILILYLTFIISARIFISWRGDFTLLFVVAILLVLASASYICPIILQKVKGLNIDLKENKMSKKEKYIWIICFFSATFMILLTWYLAYYPGIFSGDAIDQYGQALDGEYNDWHPALQTLFTYTLPLKITGRAESIILFQILEFSGVLSYLLYTILRYTKKKYAIFSFLYIILNPVTGSILMRPWKDVSFAMSAMLLMAYGLHIYITDGKWMYKKGSVPVFVGVLVVATLFRHNAILFTVPFLVAVLLFIENKKLCLKIVLYFIVLIMLIKDPVYYTVGVAMPGKRQLEMLGLPMTMLGNVAKESSESFDQKTGEFMFSVAPKEDWEALYICGSFNSIKWEDRTNLDIIEETGAAEILFMTIRTLVKAPISSLKAFFILTDMVYTLDGYCSWDISLDISENNYNVKTHKIVGSEVLVTYSDMMLDGVLKYVFYYIGVINLAVIVSVLGKYNRKNECKRVFLCIPILIYNFGTMFLLSGSDFRFFYLNFSICPIIMIILYGRRVHDGIIEINGKKGDFRGKIEAPD